MVKNLMDRIDKILNHDLFLYHLGRNNAAEADRRFCRHSMKKEQKKEKTLKYIKKYNNTKKNKKKVNTSKDKN